MEGALFGETILFTGTLGVPRQQAADMAVEARCDLVNGVSEKVTMLVVGNQDESKLRGYGKSNKHREVEELIEGGVEVQILSEGDFSELMRIDLPSSRRA